jgi:hypothetical protein
VPAILSDPIADVATAVDKLRAHDGLVTSPEQLLNESETLLDAINGLQSVLVRKLREVHHHPDTATVTGRSTRAWLHEEQLLTRGEGGRLMHLVKHLPLHPATETAYTTNVITTAAAGAILTALRHLPAGIRDDVEPHLIEFARFNPPEALAGFVDELLERLGIDKASDAARERRHASRGLDIAETLGGTRSVAGTMTPEVGARLQAALDAAGQPAGPDDDRTPRQRRHDALGEIADAYLARQQPSFTGAPRTVIVTIDLDTLEGRLRDAWITTPWGAIAPETARRLACDAELIPMVLGGKSEVLDIGQADHAFTTAQRRAAYHRDGGQCVFPRCTNPPAEVHHIKFRRHGGPTSLDNAAWLCAYHHWLVHEGGWTLERLETHDYLWTNKYGDQLIRHIGTA